MKLPCENWGNELLLRCWEQTIKELQNKGIFHEPEWSHYCDIRKELLVRMVSDEGKLQEFPWASEKEAK